LLAHGRWFSPGIPACSTNKAGFHDIAELLLKVAIKHQKSIKIINQQDKCLLLKKPQPVRHSFHL